MTDANPTPGSLAGGRPNEQQIWECPFCARRYYTAQPPEQCPFCLKPVKR
ncbi:MAG TPA: hypothetical protein VFS39_02190 [Nitrospira sp.]|nr:hypothetical protein [Nitrospira sp.]